MDGKVTLLDYDKFMKLVPTPDNATDPSTELFQGLHLENVPTSPGSAMYPALMERLNQAWLAPGHRFVATPHKSDPGDPSKLRLDGGMYSASDAPEQAQFTNWSTIELSIECKTDDVRGDPFDESTEGGEPNADDRRSILGQILTYAYLVFKKQHRTHHFTIIIFGSYARIVRWDRSGVVATRKFNFHEDPSKLGLFIWRFARLRPEQQGYDVTAERVKDGSEEHIVMQRRARDPRLLSGHKIQEHARIAFAESLKCSCWWKLRVDEQLPPGPDGKTTISSRYFLVGQPHFAARGVSGRGTRGYVAIDAADPDGAFVYLKDAWRVDHARIRKEDEILAYLNTEGVQGVPTKVCHGDVDPPRFQKTISQTIWREENANVLVCPLKSHTHYRLVVKEVGLPMSRFKNGRQLLFLISKCLHAHWNAYKKGVIHRDISAGNVLINVKEAVDDSGKYQAVVDGLLTDWELSKNLQEGDDEEGPRQPNRTGTWQFLSANVLRNSRKRIVIEDEMESFFHLVLYYAVRYLPNNLADVGHFMREYFDGFIYAGGQYVGGIYKLGAMQSGQLGTIEDQGQPLKFYVEPWIKGNPEPKLHPLSGFFQDILLRLAAYYQLYGIDNKITSPGAAHSDSVASSSQNPSGAGTALSPEDQYAADFYLSISEELEPQEDASQTLTQEKRRELEKLAKTLRHHTAMIERYSHYWRVGDWPEDDKMKDQLRKDFDPDKDPKKPKLSKSGKGSQVGSSMPQATPQAGSASQSEISSQVAEKAAASRKERGTLHDGDPFESPLAKRSATG